MTVSVALSGDLSVCQAMTRPQARHHPHLTNEELTLREGKWQIPGHTVEGQGFEPQSVTPKWLCYVTVSWPHHRLQEEDEDTVCLVSS